MFESSTESRSWMRIKDTLICLNDVQIAKWSGKVIRIVFRNGTTEIIEFVDAKSAGSWFDSLWKAMGEEADG